MGETQQVPMPAKLNVKRRRDCAWDPLGATGRAWMTTLVANSLHARGKKIRFADQMCEGGGIANVHDHRGRYSPQTHKKGDEGRNVPSISKARTILTICKENNTSRKELKDATRPFRHLAYPS